MVYEKVRASKGCLWERLCVMYRMWPVKKVACVKDFLGRTKHSLYKGGLCKTFLVQVLCVKLCTCKLVQPFFCWVVI